MVLSDAAVLKILTDLLALKNQVWQMCFYAWGAVAAIQLMAGAIGWKVANRVIWPAFVYPIGGLALLQGYDDLVWNLVEVPQNIGWDFAVQAFEEAMKNIDMAANGWANPAGGLVQVIFLNTWAFMIQEFQVAVLVFTIGVFGLLQMVQVAVIGVLYVLGPVFCLAASFKGTASFAARWGTSVVEVSSWTAIWGVLLKAQLVLADTIVAKVPDPKDPDSIMNTIQQISLIAMYGLMTLAVPLISRALIGGGIGVMVAGAATAAMSTVTSAVASEMKSSSSGGGGGGNPGSWKDGGGPGSDKPSDPRAAELEEAA